MIRKKNFKKMWITSKYHKLAPQAGHEGGWSYG